MPTGVYTRKPSPPSPPCNFPGCDRLQKTNGLCGAHYQQLRSGRELRPLFETIRPRGTPPRIKYDEVPCSEWGITQGLTTPCHIFIGAKSNGYGYVCVNGTMKGVHVVVWEQKHGPVEDGKDVDHQCRVRDCCNVDHLRAVTHQVNTTENVVGIGWQIQAAKTHCKYGHPYDEENTYHKPNGARACRICRRAEKKKRQEQERGGGCGTLLDGQDGLCGL